MRKPGWKRKRVQIEGVRGYAYVRTETLERAALSVPYLIST